MIRSGRTISMNEEFNMTDPSTGKKPTSMQLRLLQLLSPFYEAPTYARAAKELNVSVKACARRMVNLKRRCPIIHQKFHELKKGIRRSERKAKWLHQCGKIQTFQDYDSDIKERF